ncbi:UbiA prenyltransferase family protein [Flavobacteriaceae bacterium]|jgi:decaprenyl-phosphate phosphoribosyltransferase|nr:UbiA prenyltransferase family protein [Flavobacteriaceae bacterium]
MSISAALRIMRPKHYIKNFFIFLPLFFDLKISDYESFYITFLSFISFSLTASSVYIFNDYFDIEEDKLHPLKKYRPLAIGSITKFNAILLMFVLVFFGLTLMYTLSINSFILLLIYVTLNISYSMFLKHISIVDVNIIAIGFVIRLFVGSNVTNIYLSKWVIIMTFLLALFIALAKRRGDVLIYKETGIKMRKVVDGYNLRFLDSAMSIMASVVIVVYTIYTSSPAFESRFENEYIYLSSFFVILGIMRYLKIIFINNVSGSPVNTILNDRFLQLILLGWVMIMFWFIY